MSAKNSKRFIEARARQDREVDVGGDTYLDRDIPFGLFEACNGNKYIITDEIGIKMAVALRHRHLPAFTCQALSSSPLEYGQCWGPCRLLLIHALPKGVVGGKPGTIGFAGHTACLDC